MTARRGANVRATVNRKRRQFLTEDKMLREAAKAGSPVVATVSHTGAATRYTIGDADEREGWPIAGLVGDDPWPS